MNLFEALQQQRVLLLDGAVGTELSLRGQKMDLPLWGSHCLMKRPELIHNIHLEYLNAGADLICSHSFRTQGYVLDKAKQGARSEFLTKRSVELCHKALQQQKRQAWVLGSMAPLEDCYRPQDTPPYNILFREHRAHAKQLSAAGVHGFILETFSHLREIRAALMACAPFKLPTILSLHNTNDLENIIHNISSESWAPSHWSVNCHTPGEITQLHARLKQSVKGPTAAYAQVGYKKNGQWHETGLVTPAEYAVEAMKWVKQGAKIIGGCCGTRPSYIAALRQLLDKS